MAHRILYTAILFMGHVTLGLLIGIGGPSLVDFQYLIRSWSDPNKTASMNEISFSFTFLMVGAMVGSFISFAYKWKAISPYLNRELFTAFTCLVYGISSAFTPRTTTLWAYYSLIFFSSVGCGNWNTVSTTWLMEMWTGKRLASLLQAKQLMYGVGTILGPLIMEPFVSGYTDPESITAEEIATRRYNMTVPFAICGALQTLVGLVILVLYFTREYRYVKVTILPESGDVQQYSIDGDGELEKPRKLFDVKSNQGNRTIFFLMVMGIFATYNLCEIGHLNFQNAFFQSLSSVNISAAEAAEISSITATSYTAGRGISILITNWISSANELAIHFSLTLLSFIGLCWTQYTNQTLIRINSVFLGFALSAIIPAMFSYVNYYTVVDDRRTAMFFVALRLPSIFSPFLIGPYIETFPSILLYIDIISISLALLLFGGARVLVWRSTAKLDAKIANRKTQNLVEN